MKNLPIVFVHFGNDNYLNIVLHQARSSNPGAEIVLLGDDSNKKSNKLCTHYLYNNFDTGIDELEKNYVHLSSNNYQYEFFCIKRWFIIRNYMRDKNLEWVFTADSDVLLYAPVQDYFMEGISQTKYEAAYCIIDQDYDQFRWTASGGIAYVSLHFIENFCNYISEIYKYNIALLSPKMEYHVRANAPGGIADMTFFYLYYYFINRNILNLLIPIGDKVFNNGIYFKNNIYEAEMEKSFCYHKILIEKKKPFFINQDHQKIFFQCLHFQGGYKNDIFKFYLGKMNSYILELELKNYWNAAKVKFRLPTIISKFSNLKKRLLKPE